MTSWVDKYFELSRNFLATVTSSLPKPGIVGCSAVPTSLSSSSADFWVDDLWVPLDFRVALIIVFDLSA